MEIKMDRFKLKQSVSMFRLRSKKMIKAYKTKPATTVEYSKILEWTEHPTSEAEAIKCDSQITKCSKRLRSRDNKMKKWLGWRVKDSWKLKWVKETKLEW